MASSTPLLFIALSTASLFSISSCNEVPIHDVDLRNPVIELILSSVDGSSSTVKDVAPCKRVRIVGLLRTQLTSYPNSLHVLVNASDTLPERHHKKVELCFHRNASAELCHCEMEDWRNLKMGQFSTIMSPYQNKFIDIKYSGGISGSITISVEEEMKQWRIFCLGIGFLLLLLAPVVSKWVPFYYSSSMALGILLVVLLLLFQGMKLVPMGRKNFLYLTLYGSVLGLGSLLAHYFSMFVNSILVSFGLSEEMHHPVSLFALIFLVLLGAAIGYWTVRKFVLSEDGTVDAGIAQFVKWAMRMLAVMLIFQSTHDSILAIIALAVCWNISSLITSSHWVRAMLQQRNLMEENLWQQTARRASANHRNAEFLSPQIKAGARKTAFGSRSRPYSWSSSPAKGLIMSRPRNAAAVTSEQRDYYSTFHQVPTQRYSKKEWEDFTRESTKTALAEWASTPEVSTWIAENAHRIRLKSKDASDDDDDDNESSSGSSEEVIEDSPGFFSWI